MTSNPVVQPSMTWPSVGHWADISDAIVGSVVIEPTIFVQLLVFGVLLGGIYGFAALGLTIIFGVMDIINVAHGAIMVVGMYTVWVTATAGGVSPFLGIPLAVLVSIVLGVGLFRVTIAPVMDDGAGSSLVVTLAHLLIIVAAVEVLFSPTPRTLDVDLGSLSIGGIHVLRGQLYALAVGVIVFGLTWGFLHMTRTGRAIRGTADNREGARYVGIDVPYIDALTFGLGAGLAGLAGALLPFVQSFDPYLGNHYLTIAFVVVVLGGLGSIRGAILGGLVIGMIHVFGSFYLPGSTFQILIFLVFILVLLFKPTGLFGRGRHD